MPHRPPKSSSLAAALLTSLALLGACSGGEPEAAPTVTVTVTALAPTSAAPSSKKGTVLTEEGVGLKTTRTFVVHGDWDLAYSYDCGGQRDRFSVEQVGGDEETYVDEIGTGRSSTTHLHNGPGEMALKVSGRINSCNWKIKVIQR